MRQSVAKRGPKFIEIDWKQFEGLCRLHCTAEEICGILDISQDTLERACKKKYKANYAEVFRQKAAAGKMSLRRRQYQAAMSPNASPSMLIWLGKQWLGQKDKQEIFDGDATETELKYVPRDTIPWKKLPK